MTWTESCVICFKLSVSYKGEETEDHEIGRKPLLQRQ